MHFKVYLCSFIFVIPVYMIIIIVTLPGPRSRITCCKSGVISGQEVGS